MPNRFSLTHSLPCLAVVLAFHAPGASGADQRVSFNRDVRPILSDKCFYCHGPDEKNREADLRLDKREIAISDLGGYKAIVPGNPEESELLTRVTSKDKDEMMPPPKAKKARLTEKEIATLRQWIKEGAEYEGHWAFLPLSEAATPKPEKGGVIRNEIDQFILSRLERDGVQASPEADRATLLRRVTLDLTGLLPNPEEVREFLQDQAPDAYEKVVNRLLASPHYGERWGRHWLDQARYADSNGYSVDGEREQWPYRDWVIKAMNDDMPFDQFTIEQLAGDLLPNPTKSQLIATAFHRNTLINQEGGTDKEQFRVEAVMDRVNTTGAVWLGLTVGCAQCHTHKFDPITHREYYEMMTFFNSGEDVNDKGTTLRVAEGEVFGRPPQQPPPPAAPSAEQLLQRQALWEKSELMRLDKRAAKATPNGPAQWLPAKYLEYGTESNASFTLLPDNSLLSDQRGSSNDVYRVLIETPAKKVAAIRLRVLTHETLPKNGPGLASNGNLLLTDFSVMIGGKELAIAKASADHEQADYPITGAIDDDPQSGWAINTGKGGTGKINADHEALFILAEPAVTNGLPIEIKMHHDRNKNYLIGRFALEFAETAPAADDKEHAFFAALKTAAGERTPAQTKAVSDAFAASETKKVTAEQRSVTPTAELMIMRDLEKPRDSFLLTRGDFTRPDHALGKLEAGVIKAIAPALPPAANRTRMDLARWLVNPENPLTPRVAMNRVWMHYFGRGLVETDEDFGAQGSAPTHPDLLDWLGREFIRRGWSLKAMHRLIVTSATYRQSSRMRPDLADKDPRNLLLARQERVRFDAEVVRDAALCASGLLNPKIGGPSVKPPQPEGVYSFTQTAKKWNADTGPNRYRRALYTLYYRSAPYPLFTTFDAPDFQTVCTRRNRSNTPLQSLTLANDPAFFEIAQAFAVRIVGEVPAGPDSIKERARRATVLALGRDPTDHEMKTLTSFATAQFESFRADPAAARSIAPKILTAAGVSEAEAATLVCLARVLINADNFITRE